MYNRQLVTFLKVADTGSFSKAAELLYISPSAVIQQINNLERDLNATLFVRSRQGITLTPAGEYLAEEAKTYIDRGEQIKSRLLELDIRKPCIHVGSSLEEKCRLLYDLWILFSPGNQKYDIRLLFMPDGGEMPRQAELVESVKDGASWQEGWEFLELFYIPIGCAIARDHPWWGKKCISLQDMRQSPVIVIERGNPKEKAILYQQLEKASVSYETRTGFNGALIWQSSLEKKALLVPFCWDDALFDLTVIPCEIEYALPYGFFYRKNAGTALVEFLDFVRNLYSGDDPHAIIPVL